MEQYHNCFLWHVVSLKIMLQIMNIVTTIYVYRCTCKANKQKQTKTVFPLTLLTLTSVPTLNILLPFLDPDAKKPQKTKVFVGFFGQELFKVSTWSYINIPHNIFFLHILVYNYTQMIAFSFALIETGWSSN